MCLLARGQWLWKAVAVCQQGREVDWGCGPVAHLTGRALRCVVEKGHGEYGSAATQGILRWTGEEKTIWRGRQPATPLRLAEPGSCEWGVCASVLIQFYRMAGAFRALMVVAVQRQRVGMAT
eukprot:XP_001700823.1 predicted protein [Chlamydomonas reinhardtii]